eukprot:1544511-Pleurochrysis_carterae.AAC.1
MASSTATMFKSSERVRAEQRCANGGDAMAADSVDAGPPCGPGGEGGAEGVAALARSGSRVRRTPWLALSSTLHDRLRASTALSASSRAIA